jgi:hypothetical protein
MDPSCLACGILALKCPGCKFDFDGFDFDGREATVGGRPSLLANFSPIL